MAFAAAHALPTDRRAGLFLGRVHDEAAAAPTASAPVTAFGVTFAVFARACVNQQRANGDPAATVRARIGASRRAVVPGTGEAAAPERGLMENGLRSRDIEAAIGPDAVIFSTSPVPSPVGRGARIGIRSASTGDSPEPEIVPLLARAATR